MKQISFPYSHIIIGATDRNDHAYSIMFGLKAIENLDENILKEKLDQLAEIQRRHRNKGYMTPELMTERHEIYKFMLEKAKENMTEDCYNKFYSCF